MFIKNKNIEPQIRFSKKVLDSFRHNVGRYPAETGGMLASSEDQSVIDTFYFDKLSKNTGGSFYYDVESMSSVYRDWLSNGFVTNGIVHSHPLAFIRPSFHDIASSNTHMDFFETDYFYLPIIQPRPNGCYTMFFYIVRKEGSTVRVKLEYVLRAEKHGYKYPSFIKWEKEYSIKELEEYDAKNKDEKTADEEKENNYFKRIEGMFPENVLDKVIVCVGTGGARSYLENMARNGFRNFILMDADIVSATNVATQGVFVSEIGRKKTEVIRERIMDINPNANVICIDRFLDNDMSDEEFKGFMDLFPGKKPTDYIILGCTDNFEAQQRSSLLALKYGTPYLAAMMYAKGSAAEIIFNYPGVTESCPRCMLRSRFEAYENGYVNDVTSSGCTIFATERMNALKGYISLMLLNYNEDPENPWSSMLDAVKDRNFVQIRLSPDVGKALGVTTFDSVFSQNPFTYMDETIWIPQVPDSPENGYETCKLCGGTGHLENLYMKWPDTRSVSFSES